MKRPGLATWNIYPDRPSGSIDFKNNKLPKQPPSQTAGMARISIEIHNLLKELTLMMM